MCIAYPGEDREILIMIALDSTCAIQRHRHSDMYRQGYRISMIDNLAVSYPDYPRFEEISCGSIHGDRDGLGLISLEDIEPPACQPRACIMQYGHLV
jgi:hypothetical protein